MGSGQLVVQRAGDETSDRRGRELGTPDLLQLLSAGATGAILMALGKRPLRTKELTQRVPGYAPRTIYRYAGKLAELGVIEREEEPGVPSKVVHRLSDPCGRELYELLDAYATASLGRLPNGQIGAHSWGTLALLADLWESALIGELNAGPRTATELARGQHGLSYHQVSRRASLFAIGGLIREVPGPGRRRKYELTEKTRRGMALIASIGRWRRRYVVRPREAGLSPAEAAEVLRTALPLAALPEQAGKSFRIDVVSPDQGSDENGQLVWAAVTADGAVSVPIAPPGEVDGWGRGPVEAWVDAVLDGPSGEAVRVGGDGSLIHSCLAAVHRALWKREG